MAATLLTSAMVCAAVVALHLANQRALSAATEVVADLRHARFELLRGIVDLWVAPPETRTGLQTRIDILHEMTHRDLAPARNMPEVDEAALEVEFHALLESLISALEPGASRRALGEMRDAYRAVDQRLEMFDTSKLQATNDLAQAQDRVFLTVLAIAMALMGAISAATLWTERRRRTTADSLRDSEERFRGMFDHSPLPKVMVDEHGKFVAVNRRFKSVVGYTLEDIPTAAEWRDKAYPPDVDRAEIAARLHAHLATAQREGSAEPFEMTIICKDGTVRDTLVSAVRLAGGILASFTDITEHKRAGKALHDAAMLIESDRIRNRLESALRAMSDSVCITDIDGRYVHLNEAFSRVHRIAGLENCPAQHDDLVPLIDILAEQGEPLPPEMRPLRRALRGEVGADIEYRVRRVGTDEAWIGSYTFAPIRDRDETIVGAVVTVRDVTQRRCDEAKLRESQAQLAQAQKMEAVGQLTGGIAHDFNNLLAVVLGNLELLRLEGFDTDDAEELLSTALRAAGRGAELTRRLLAFSRRQTLQPRRVDLNAMVDGLHGLLKRTLGANIQIETELFAGIGGVIADPAQLESALLNLAVNARDAMPDGGKLTLSTRTAEIDADYARTRPEVVPGIYEAISVTDNGAGMTPNVAARAFEPFFTTKGVGKGSGLGLSMVYGFAKQSGGHASIYSEPGHGTTVTIYLPRMCGDSRGAPSTVEPAEMAAGHGETVLVVEDDADICRLIRRHLRALNYNVAVAVDGPQALSLLAGGLAPAALLTDVMMPGGMNGLDVARAARERHPDIPIVYMSGFADGGEARDQIVADGRPFLQKPFTKAQLAEAMARAFGKRSVAA